MVRLQGPSAIDQSPYFREASSREPGRTPRFDGGVRARVVPKSPIRYTGPTLDRNVGAELERPLCRQVVAGRRNHREARPSKRNGKVVV